jgi:hypothetical protein
MLSLFAKQIHNGSPKCRKNKQSQAQQSRTQALPPALRTRTIRSIMPIFHSLHNHLPCLFNPIFAPSNYNCIVSVSPFRNINGTSRFISNNSNSLTTLTNDEIVMFRWYAKVSRIISPNSY